MSGPGGFTVSPPHKSEEITPKTWPHLLLLQVNTAYNQPFTRVLSRGRFKIKPMFFSTIGKDKVVGSIPDWPRKHDEVNACRKRWEDNLLGYRESLSRDDKVIVARKWYCEDPRWIVRRQG